MAEKLLLINLFVFLSFFAVGCGKDKKPSANITDSGAIAVRAVEINFDSLEIQITGIGQIVEKSRIQISSEVPGIIREMSIAVGERVYEGEIVARLDDSDFALVVKGAEAAVEVGRKAVLSAESSMMARVHELEREYISLNSEREKCEYLLDDARRNLDRKRKLFTVGGITINELDNSERAYESAAIDLKRVIDSIKSLNLEGGLKDIKKSPAIAPYIDGIKQAQAELERLEGELEIAEKNRAKTLIRAPMGGVVLEKKAEEGSRISGGDGNILTLLDISRVYAQAFFDESAILSLKNNVEAEIRLDALPGAVFIGVLRELRPEIDGGTRSFRARFELENRDERLYPGMFARISVMTKKVKNALAVPRDALLNIGGNEGVFVISQGTAFFKSISTGMITEDKVEIIGGLNPGDIVAFEGHERLKDLDPVNADILNTW